MRAISNAHRGRVFLRPLVVALAALWAVADTRSPAAEDAPASDRLIRPGGPKIEGRLLFDPALGFRFRAAGGAGSSPQIQTIGPGGVVEFAPGSGGTVGVPPAFQAMMGEQGKITGTLRAITPHSATLEVPWQTEPVSMRRPGVQAIVQRLGEARVLADDFDALDTNIWGVVGRPRAVVEDGESALLLPPGGSSIEHRFGEAIEAGRVDLTFRDDGIVRPGRAWMLILTFRAPGGSAPLRVLLGWAAESLAVETPNGPSLPVQRLSRNDAWRRLTVRFAVDRTEVSVDGKDLAHGRGPTGPLESIRIATEGEPADDAGTGGSLGAIQVARFVAVPSSLELDPSQDEARLVVGDQLFGSVVRGDRERVEMTVDDRSVALSWKDLAGVYFRREAAAANPVSGALARVEWRSTDDYVVGAARPSDFAEGAVTSLTDSALVLATPYAGSLTIPRERLTRLTVHEPGLRLVLDASSHHLGNEVATSPPFFDPPLPEGGVLERGFDVPPDALGPAFVVLDVLGVVGEATGLPFSEYVRRGELKTYVVVDGRRLDYLNRFVDNPNETVLRIRVPIPADAVRPGEHLLRIEQTGTSEDAREFDDLGVAGLAVEFAAPAALKP